MSMSQALRKAGVKSSADKLAEAVAAAHAAHPRHLIRAQAALADLVYADPALCRAAFAGVADRVFGDLLRKHVLAADKERRRDIKAVSGGVGHRAAGTHITGARTTGGTAGEGGQRSHGDQAANAAPAAVAAIPGHAAVARVARQTILDTMRTENGTPLGDETKFSLQDLARRSGQRSWFYDAMQRVMPPIGKARDAWSGEDTERLWQKAQTVNQPTGAPA